MTAIRNGSILALGIATVCIFAAILMVDGGLSALWVLLPISFVAIGRYKTWRWAYGFALFFFAFLVVVGSFREYNNILLLTTIISSFIAWDLDAFATRLDSAERIDNSTRLIRTHLISLIVLVVLASVLFAVARGITLELDVWTAIVLGMLLVYGLTQTLRYLRNSDL